MKLITMRAFTVLLLFTCFSVTFISCGSSKHAGKSSKLAGNWQSLPVVIDGDAKEWPSPYPNYDSKGMIAYATSNDKDNLYLTIETGDEYIQTKILKAGLTVYIDPTGNKEQTMAIHYPMPDDNNPLDIPRAMDEAHGMSKHNGETDYRKKEMTQKIRKSLADATQISFEGFGECSGGYIVTQNKCGIKVRVGMDEYNELIWEASIPIKALYNKPQLDKGDEGKPVSVCFAIKGFKKPAEGGQSNSSGGMGNGGGGMNSGMGSGGMSRGGGGMHGGSGRKGGTPDNPRDHLYESTKTWKQFGLAYQ